MRIRLAKSVGYSHIAFCNFSSDEVVPRCGKLSRACLRWNEQLQSYRKVKITTTGRPLMMVLVKDVLKPQSKQS